MLGLRRKLLANVKLALYQRVVFAGTRWRVCVRPTHALSPMKRAWSWPAVPNIADVAKLYVVALTAARARA